jgi:endonuclease G
MHKGRRLALFTAANVDWRRKNRLVNGKKPTRAELRGFKNGAERWATDWRIDDRHQLPDIFFTEDDQMFDKGHLVRRDDVCWGTSFKDIQKANGDTYHTTNCSPQTMAFNQAGEGEDNWGDLENVVQTETNAEKAILFSGPVLDEDDPLFSGTGENGEKLDIRIPRRYWKIVVVKGAEGPETYGFVLEQDLSTLEFAVPSEWTRHMKSIEEIENMLHGWVDLDWLKEHDRFGSEEAVNIAEQVQ